MSADLEPNDRLAPRDAVTSSSLSSASPPKSSPDILSRNQLVMLFESSRAIHSEINPKETINVILRETLRILMCDRCTLYIYDECTELLTLSHSVELGRSSVKLKPGVGIAGSVFLSEKIIRIDDCYSDPRFDPTVDKFTGYKTKSILTCPVFDKFGRVVAVLQAINKLATGQSADLIVPTHTTTSTATHFTDEDEAMITHFALLAGVALRNAAVYKEVVVTRDRADGLLTLLQSLRKDLGIQSALLTLTTHAKQLVQGEHCTVFLVDAVHSQLWSISTDTGAEIRQPLTAGIAGSCASTGELIVCTGREPLESSGCDESGARNILCLPILSESESKVIGVIEVVNKTDDDGERLQFTEEDARILEVFGRVVGPKLEASDFGAIASKEASTEAGLAFCNSGPGRSACRSGIRSVMSERQVIREAEREDEED